MQSRRISILLKPDKQALISFASASKNEWKTMWRYLEITGTLIKGKRAKHPNIRTHTCAQRNRYNTRTKNKQVAKERHSFN
jgi:hypothetical protein